VSLPSGASKGASLATKYQTRLEVADSDKHIRLQLSDISYAGKNFKGMYLNVFSDRILKTKYHPIQLPDWA